MRKEVNIRKLPFLVLRGLHRLAPFDIRGDLGEMPKPMKPGKLSCLIIASNRSVQLEGLLWDLAGQSLSKAGFEVVVLNDGAGTEVRCVVESYRDRLTIVYDENPQPHRILSNLRNMSIRLSEGEYLLFLDDDTRIFQTDFLERALSIFRESGAGVILPRAQSLYGILKAKFDFLDTYSVTNRCSLYRRSVIESIRGFNRDLNTYEDTELSMRLAIGKFKTVCTDELAYLHPPLYFDSLNKPLAIGQTIFQIRPHYSLPVWLLVYMNGLRFLAYAFIPTKINRQWLKISLGVFLFPFMRRRSFYY